MSLQPGVARRLAKEIAALEANPPDGIRVDAGDNLAVLNAYLQGPNDTPFAGGVFKMKLAFGVDFPTAPPKGVCVMRGELQRSRTTWPD